jgi:hypothetical protein
MIQFKSLSVAAVLSFVFVAPAFAQAAIQEPGTFSFYYPNNDVLNGGRPPPAAGMDAKMPAVFGSNPYVATHNTDVSCSEQYRSFDPASGTFLGRDGRRHECD